MNQVKLYDNITPAGTNLAGAFLFCFIEIMNIFVMDMGVEK